MELFVNIVMKQIYLFNIVALNKEQYPLSFKEFFVADFFLFYNIFSDGRRPKSINVWKDLFAPTAHFSTTTQ